MNEKLVVATVHLKAMDGYPVWVNPNAIMVVHGNAEIGIGRCLVVMMNGMVFKVNESTDLVNSRWNHGLRGEEFVEPLLLG